MELQKFVRFNKQVRELLITQFDNVSIDKAICWLSSVLGRKRTIVLHRSRSIRNRCYVSFLQFMYLLSLSIFYSGDGKHFSSKICIIG